MWQLKSENLLEKFIVLLKSKGGEVRTDQSLSKYTGILNAELTLHSVIMTPALLFFWGICIKLKHSAESRFHQPSFPSLLRFKKRKV